MVMESRINSKNTAVVLILIILFGVLLRFVFSVGIIGSGDFVHLIYSQKASVGNFSLTIDDPQTAARIGYVYPVALFYRIFGISEFSMYFYTLIMSAASIILIYFLGKLFFSRKVGLVSAFFLSFYPLNVNYSTQGYPDLAMAFFAGLAVYFFFLGEKNNSKGWWLNLLCGISIGMAVLTKESGIIIFLFLGLYVLYKIFLKKEGIKGIKPGYLLIGLGFVLVMLLLMFHNYIVSGDFFLRYKMIDRVYYSAIKNLYNYHGYKLIERLFIHVPYMMLTNLSNFGFFTIFFIMASAYCIIFRKKESFPVMLWLTSLFLYLNFGSTSLTNYLPLPGGTPRYFEMLTLPAILLLGFFVSEADKIISKFISPFTVIFLLITSVGFIHLNPDRNAVHSERELAKFINAQQPLKIYSDGNSKDILDFFTGYRQDIIMYWKGNYPEKGSAEIVKPNEMFNAYVIVNKHLMNKNPENYEVDYPDAYYGNVPEIWVLLKTIKNKDGDILVYYAP